ncbi:MAG: DNA polymerase III subunit delta [Phenylobacterium sp.]|uniref:DNA polymerase III subunit delta n=1 Tax=Phenylobacterium sp. TaxID=1871053 RepID=UPI0027357A31|nr:DNA polymerase III subunit delta [Phenylobacterium sp.]MDP3173982.1 DNA polymerase III subunit delta [Phenylobacterium sp.]
MILAKRPDIERFLAKPQAGVRAALIYGRDMGVVRERAEQLARVVTDRPDDPFDVAVLTDRDIDGDAARLEGELSAQSMMGGRRLVRLRLGGEKASVDKIAAEAMTGHAEGRFNTDAFFIVEAGALGRESTLRKQTEKAAAGAIAIPCYEDEPGDVARLVREALAKDNVALNADALAMFTARLPKERGVARAEIERLILYLGPGSGVTAQPADLEPFLGVEPEASLADAASDAFGGRLAAAQSGLRRAAAEGEGGPAAVRAVGQHLARLRRTLTLAKAGAGLQEAAKASGVFWKNEREFLRQARTWSLEALDELQPQVLDADRACKQTGSPDQLIAERLALSVAGRARRMGL